MLLSEKEKNLFFVQNDLFWTHTAKTKHFLVECVLKRPQLFCQSKEYFKMCFIFGAGLFNFMDKAFSLLKSF